MKLDCNCCDGAYNSYDIHFTSACDNQCAHCIDSRFHGLGIKKPDPSSIINTIMQDNNLIDDVLFLGGEPCLYLEELFECVRYLKRNSTLKVYVTTAVPKTCYDNKELFVKILRESDGVNLSVQHHDEHLADAIRRTISKYDRQAFYESLPYKEKLRINLNVVKPYLFKKQDILDCLAHYCNKGFRDIKLSEIQHGKEHYVNASEVLGLNLKSPYSNGCQQYVMLPGIPVPILLKRSCFLCEDTLKASFSDGIKLLTKFVVPTKNTYGVVYGDGTLTNGWV